MTPVDVFSDFVCPWCWIGKRNLDALVSEGSIVRRWWPYYLNPDTPDGGVDRRDMVIAKFGSEERARELGRGVEAAAAEAGLALRLGVAKRIPNTRNAHRLMRWAAGQGVADAVAEALFAAYFDAGQDIGDADVLVSIAVEGGMDGTLVADLLAGDADTEVVGAQAEHARAMGINGVPTMVFDRKATVVGAQPVDKLRRVVERLG